MMAPASNTRDDRPRRAAGDDPAAARVEQLLAWFAEHGRDWPWRRTRDRWIVLVSEVCLQQTQVQRAAPFVERILARFPTPAELAAAPLGELLAMWKGLGYPRRARNLHLAAQAIVEHGAWPDDYRDLPGVGPYTDAALRCFADEQPVVPPDINTRRVLARAFADLDTPPDPADHPALAGRAWHWGQAVMELGQRTCRARAACDECPLLELCPSAGTDEVVASPRQARFQGSMRQRRGILMGLLAEEGACPVDRDPDAAASLVADGLALDLGDGTLAPP